MLTAVQGLHTARKDYYNNAFRYAICDETVTSMILRKSVMGALVTSITGWSSETCYP